MFLSQPTLRNLSRQGQTFWCWDRTSSTCSILLRPHTNLSFAPRAHVLEQHAFSSKYQQFLVVQTCKLANIECNLAIRNQHLQYTNGGQSHFFIFMPYANEGRPLSVVRISAFTDCEATHAKKGYRYVFSLCTLSKSGRSSDIIWWDHFMSHPCSIKAERC